MSYFLIFLGSILRILPHPANFAPIGALALFGGAKLNRKQALLLPIAAMMVSDVFIGFDSIASRASVYGSFLLIGLIGMAIRKKGTFAMVSGSLIGSILFYLITNFVFFHQSGLYPHTIPGLLASYTNAIPFFRNTLLSDLFYSAVFFGSYELVRYYFPRLAKNVPDNQS